MKNRFQTRIIRICIVKMIRIPAWTIGPTFSVQTFAFVKCTVKQLYWNCLLILLLLILSIFSKSTANVSFYLLSCVYRSLATLSYILYMLIVNAGLSSLSIPMCGKGRTACLCNNLNLSMPHSQDFGTLWDVTIPPQPTITPLITTHL